MFGYIRPFRDEMRIKDYQLYKSVYCGLCKSMKKNYGILSTLTLNYDCTVLAILYMSVKKEKCSVRKERCSVNPFKNCLLCSCEGDALRFSGAVSVIMCYQKLRDTIIDSAFPKKIAAVLGRIALYYNYKKAVNAYPYIDDLTAEMMGKQLDAEKTDSGVDRSADPTAKLISKLCMSFSDDERLKRTLSVFGYHIGRWIYLMDAADDLEKDIKHHNFNPFSSRYEGDIKDTMKYCNEVLNMTVAQIILAYELLELHSFKAVLDNIIYSGLSYQQKNYTEMKYISKNKTEDLYNALDNETDGE